MYYQLWVAYDSAPTMVNVGAQQNVSGVPSGPWWKLSEVHKLVDTIHHNLLDHISRPKDRMWMVRVGRQQASATMAAAASVVTQAAMNAAQQSVIAGQQAHHATQQSAVAGQQAQHAYNVGASALQQTHALRDETSQALGQVKTGLEMLHERQGAAISIAQHSDTRSSEAVRLAEELQQARLADQQNFTDQMSQMEKALQKQMEIAESAFKSIEKLRQELDTSRAESRTLRQQLTESNWKLSNLSDQQTRAQQAQAQSAAQSAEREKDNDAPSGRHCSPICNQMQQSRVSGGTINTPQEPSRQVEATEGTAADLSRPKTTRTTIITSCTISVLCVPKNANHQHHHYRKQHLHWIMHRSDHICLRLELTTHLSQLVQAEYHTVNLKGHQLDHSRPQYSQHQHQQLAVFTADDAHGTTSTSVFVVQRLHQAQRATTIFWRQRSGCSGLAAPS